MSIAPIQTAFSDETERSPRLSLLCGYAQAQGSRPYQQDCLSVIDNGLLAVDAGGQPAPFEAAPETDKGKPKHSLFGIFDGHGSSDYAQHAANTVHDLVVNDPAFAEGNYPVALANSFFKEDKELLEKVHPEEERGGTTATVALIVDGILYIVNVGDSRAVLAERGEGTDYFAIRVSQDHKTSLPKEQARLAKSEAVVAQGRVHTKTHSLNMTRALGDFAFKAPKNEKEQDWVSSAPTIVRVELGPAHDFLVLASDGLWDAVDDEAAVEWISDRKEEGVSPQEAAETLCKRIGKVQGSDNISIIIVFFQWEDEQQS